MLRRKLLARGTAARGLLLVAVTVGMVLAAGVASASLNYSPKTHGMPFAAGSMKKVIILLRDKPAGLAARSKARSELVKAEVAPLAQKLRLHGATHVASGRAFPFVVASVSSGQEAALKHNAAVKAVFPDAVIPAPTAGLPGQQLFAPTVPSTPTSSSATGGSICGTATAPENDPEALSAINAQGALALGVDGAGVSTAYIAGDIDPAIADFQRNAAYASSGSPTGSPVVTEVNFNGDPAGTPGGEVAGESFLDASSIAAQGNSTYDLNHYVNPVHPLPSSPCDITITGAAPGATVMGLDVFSNTHGTTESNFIQAIDYAVSHGVKVLNESFGSNPFPDTAADATRIADDDAVAAGVTVVASSGDSGITNTIGSPSTDPKVISVGASTTLRAYQQLTYGGINATVPNATNGTWLNNNISSISSSGFSQAGNTVDLVAPGRLELGRVQHGSAVRGQHLHQLRQRGGEPIPVHRRHERVVPVDGCSRGGRDPGVPEHARRLLPVAGARQADPDEHRDRRRRSGRAARRRPAEHRRGRQGGGVDQRRERHAAGRPTRRPESDQHHAEAPPPDEAADQHHEHRQQHREGPPLHEDAHPQGREPEWLILPQPLLVADVRPAHGQHVPDLERRDRGLPGGDVLGPGTPVRGRGSTSRPTIPSPARPRCCTSRSTTRRAPSPDTRFRRASPTSPTCRSPTRCREHGPLSSSP